MMIKSKALKLVFDSACWSKKIECNKLPPLPPVLRKRERKRERERERERKREREEEREREASVYTFLWFS